MGKIKNLRVVIKWKVFELCKLTLGSNKENRQIGQITNLPVKMRAGRPVFKTYSSSC
jgi:hypothetical protein